MRKLLHVLFASLLFAVLPAQAQTLQILTAGAFKQVVLDFIPAFEARTGLKVALQNDTAGALAKRIEGGEAFDLVFLPPAGLRALAAQGKVDAASIRPVARVGIGVAVKAGAMLPPLQTVDQFKVAVLAAHRVAYIDPAAGGSSGVYLDGLFGRLGLADAVRAKAVLVPGGFVAERVARNEADLAIHQVSEILPVAGVVLAGPLPEAIQNYTVYGGAIAAGTRQAEAAAAFIAAVRSAEAGERIRAKGMQPVNE